MLVEGDSGLLEIALQNLLGNAWKYSAKQPAPSISFASRRSNNEIQYYITDNGLGFDMAHSKMLFKPFSRLHVGSDIEGSGIGLATVASILRRHHGRIWAEAYPDKGATFFFTIPNQQPDNLQRSQA